MYSLVTSQPVLRGTKPYGLHLQGTKKRSMCLQMRSVYLGKGGVVRCEKGQYRGRCGPQTCTYKVMCAQLVTYTVPTYSPIIMYIPDYEYTHVHTHVHTHQFFPHG